MTKYAADYPFPKLSPIEWSYLAGLIDGEGTVTIDRTQKGKDGRYSVFRPSLVFCTTTPVLTDWCWERLPLGSMYATRVKNVRHKPMHRILWVYNPALYIIRNIRPYLVLKGEQADIVLGMPISTRGRWGFTEDIRNKQIAAWTALRMIRGRVGVPLIDPIEATLPLQCSSYQI